MSKEVDWSVIHGEGTIECDCDMCGSNYQYEFYDGYPDFKECQEELKKLGWVSRKINGEWCDFCCNDCLNKFMGKENVK